MSTKALLSAQSCSCWRFAPTATVGVPAGPDTVAVVPAAANPKSAVVGRATAAVPTSVQVPSAPVGDEYPESRLPSRTIFSHVGPVTPALTASVAAAPGAVRDWKWTPSAATNRA